MPTLTLIPSTFASSALLFVCWLLYFVYVNSSRRTLSYSAKQIVSRLSIEFGFLYPRQHVKLGEESVQSEPLAGPEESVFPPPGGVASDGEAPHN